MKITFWSDFACPYCYIGLTRLKRVLGELGLEGKVTIEPKSFQLRKGDSYGDCPTCGQVRQTLEGTNAAHFRKKYRLSEEDAGGCFAEMARMGASEGLDIHYETAPLVYTEDAHRLVKYAFDMGGEALAEKLAEALFYMYLTKNQDISDHRVLLGIGKAVGLTEDGILSVLTSDLYGAEVMMDGIKAGMFGINVVPHFIIDGTYAMQGVQDAEVMKEVIRTALRGG